MKTRRRALKRRKRTRGGQAIQEAVETQSHPASVNLQRTAANPNLASAADILALQRAYGNRAVSDLTQPKSPPSTLDGDDVAPGIESAIQSARGGGQPLPKPMRQSMEKTLSADLSDVRLHHNDRSDTLNRALQARAFTTQRDIFFRRGEYDPKSRQGQRLIAHELTHVVQQSGGVSQRKGAFQNKAPHPGGRVIQREISEDQFVSDTTSSFLWCIKWRVGEQSDLNVMQEKLRAFEQAKGAVEKVAKLDDLVSKARELNKRGKAKKFKAALVSIIEQAQQVRYDLTQKEEYKEYKERLKVQEQEQKELEEKKLLGKEYAKASPEERNHRLSQYKEQNSGQASLLANIQGNLTEEEALKQLLSNFWARTDFTYTFNPSSPFKGSGDCQTLRNEYMLIARDALGIKLENGDERDPMFIKGGGKIIDNKGLVGNVDNGAHWLFENHHWAVWQGTPIDVLYGLFGQLKESVKGQEIKDGPYIGYQFGDTPVYVKKERGPGDSYTLNPELAEKNPSYQD